MSADHHHTPTPDLRIVPAESLLPHEEHDHQRALPLVERLKTETFIINPPIVAPIDDDQFVILDGANRCYALRTLGYPHMIVQVVSFERTSVELLTWNHIISHWDAQIFLQQLQVLPQLSITEGQHHQAVAHLVTRSQQIFALCAPASNIHEQNAALRQVVRLYQQNAVLYRTPLSDPEEIWPLYPEAVGLLFFPPYQPADIIAAARLKAYLPPGVSRHIVHGRALRVNYPIAHLKDSDTPLQEKNEALLRWLQEKLARRQVRYYAESTYQFDE